MESQRLNYLNVGLMLLSAGLAFLFPVHLFLLAYAILGPLHYLTELSWLHDRNYFVTSKRAASFLWVLGAAILLARYVFDAPIVVSAALIYGALFVACAAVFLPSRRHVQALFVILALLPLVVFAQNLLFAIIFGILLTTMVHVFVFTGLFMLQGALKQRHRSGYIALGVFLVCSFSFFIIPFGPFLKAGPLVLANFSSFLPIVSSLQDLFGLATIPVLQFMAFAYTYHYANWFSKTRLIGWNRISKKRAVGIIVLWGLALSIYAINYKLGLSVLYFLSMVHVFLEFPLNYRSMGGIIAELKQRRIEALTKNAPTSMRDVSLDL